MKCPQQANLQRQKTDEWLPRTKLEEWRKMVNGYRFCPWDDNNVLKSDYNNGCATLLKTTESYT